jgi:hypothetical protein
MHTVISLLPFAGYLALEWTVDRWNKRPAVRAKWAEWATTHNLHDKIARMIRIRSIAVAIQVGLIALWLSLWQAGILSTGGLIAGTIVSGFYLTVNLYLLRCTLAARRAYNDLGPLAYVAEVRHAFGPTQPAQTPDATAHNLHMLSGTRPADQDMT